jgi:hypothetical protein
MKRASAREKAYFERLGGHSRELPRTAPPASLAEMFQRLETTARQLGSLAVPGMPGPGRGDLQSHLDYLHRIRAVGSAKHA